MMKIVSIWDKNIKCICVRDAIDTLDIPHVIALEIAHEHEYQNRFVFSYCYRAKHCIYLSKSILDIIHVCEIYHT